MRVFLTGSTGFVGRVVLGQLLAEGHSVRCLVRQGSEGRLPIEVGVGTRFGDICQPESLHGVLEGCDAVINLVGIIREFPGREITFDRLHRQGTLNLLSAARSQGVKRFIQMSANGARQGARSPYHRSKWQAEEGVRASTLAWTIFRPSLIFGPDDQFVNLLAALIRKAPLVPVVGNGRYLLQPVSVQDVARCFVDALKMPETVEQAYCCGGAQRLSYDQILDEIARAMGRKRARKIHQPLWLLRPMVSLLESVETFPLTRCQMDMLLEGNCCEDGRWAQTFGLTPADFGEGIRSYLLL